jgi:hypothetical protein
MSTLPADAPHPMSPEFDEWERLHVLGVPGEPITIAGLVPCRACEEPYPVAAICPDGYHFDCCDADEHNHEPVPSDTGLASSPASPEIPDC